MALGCSPGFPDRAICPVSIGYRLDLLYGTQDTLRDEIPVSLEFPGGDGESPEIMI